jgi:hypothetical protein
MHMILVIGRRGCVISARICRWELGTTGAVDAPHTDKPRPTARAAPPPLCGVQEQTDTALHKIADLSVRFRRHGLFFIQRSIIKGGLGCSDERAAGTFAGSSRCLRCSPPEVLPSA